MRTCVDPYSEIFSSKRWSVSLYVSVSNGCSDVCIWVGKVPKKRRKFWPWADLLISLIRVFSTNNRYDRLSCSSHNFFYASVILNTLVNQQHTEVYVSLRDFSKISNSNQPMASKNNRQALEQEIAAVQFKLDNQKREEVQLNMSPSPCANYPW